MARKAYETKKGHLNWNFFSDSKCQHFVTYAKRVERDIFLASNSKAQYTDRMKKKMAKIEKNVNSEIVEKLNTGSSVRLNGVSVIDPAPNVAAQHQQHQPSSSVVNPSSNGILPTTDQQVPMHHPFVSTEPILNNDTSNETQLDMELASLPQDLMNKVLSVIGQVLPPSTSTSEHQTTMPNQPPMAPVIPTISQSLSSSIPSTSHQPPLVQRSFSMPSTSHDSYFYTNQPSTSSQNPKSEEDEMFQSVPECLRDMFENCWQCPICSEVFVNSVILNCGHSFCEECIEEWKGAKSKAKTVPCPVCRADLNSQVC